MVERNLAKVEVESSRLFSRSKFQKGKPRLPFFVERAIKAGAVAKRLCTGLQIRLAQFDSGPRLQYLATSASSACVDGAFLFHNGSSARVVKLVDTADLKSAASCIRGVPVRFRSRAPWDNFPTTSQPFATCMKITVLWAVLFKIKLQEIRNHAGCSLFDGSGFQPTPLH